MCPKLQDCLPYIMQADISKFFAVKKSSEPVNPYLQKISNKNGLKKSNSFDNSVFKFELSPLKKKVTLASKTKSRSFLNEDSDSDSAPKKKGRKRKLEIDEEKTSNKVTLLITMCNVKSYDLYFAN